jgi:anti-sigma B factor antagonist
MTSFSYGAPQVTTVSRNDACRNEVRIDRQINGAVTVLSLNGDLDARTAPKAQADLSAFLPDGYPVLLDLAGIGYVSSAGLRALLMVYRKAQAKGTRIAITGASESLQTILSATGFLRFFQVARTIPEAIEALQSTPPATAGVRAEGEKTMALQITSNTNEDSVVITLVGDLDAAGAPALQVDVEQALGQGRKRLVLDLTDLNYLSSAGLRQLVFAQQKMADDIQIVLVGANPRVEQTIRMVGFDQSVVMADRVPE